MFNTEKNKNCGGKKNRKITANDVTFQFVNFMQTKYRSYPCPSSQLGWRRFVVPYIYSRGSTCEDYEVVCIFKNTPGSSISTCYQIWKGGREPTVMQSSAAKMKLINWSCFVFLPVIAVFSVNVKALIMWEGFVPISVFELHVQTVILRTSQLVNDIISQPVFPRQLSKALD